MFKDGLWTACVTPFTDEGCVDYASLEKVLAAQINADNGVVILGSTGEANTLTEQERVDVVQTALKLGVKDLIVGIPSFCNIDESKSLIKSFDQCDIAGYLMPVPPYSKPGAIGQTMWFEEILNSTSKDVMLYNIPGRSSSQLHPIAVENLRNHVQFTAIKDSSGAAKSVKEYKLAASSIKIFCGDDDLVGDMCDVGARGLISVASNIWPKAMKQYVAYCMSSCDANDEISDMDKISFRALFSASNPIPVKAMMAHLGMISSNKVRLPLHADDLGELDDLLILHDAMSEFEKI